MRRWYDEQGDVLTVEEEMSFRDALEHLRLRAMRKCDTHPNNLAWSLYDVQAVWTIHRAHKDGKL